MKRVFSPGLPLLLFIVCVVPAARAQFSTLVQEASFSFAVDGTVDGTGFREYHVAGPTAFTASIQPFDLSLGTLESITVAWNATMTGTISDSSGMMIETRGDQRLFLGSVGYNGYGNGKAGEKTATFTMQHTETFLVSEANIRYDPALLDWVTGASNYDLQWSGGLLLRIDNALDGENYSASAVGSVSVTYTYSAIPEPSTYAMIFGSAALGLAVWRRRRKIAS